MQFIGENVMTPHQIWTNFFLITYGIWFKTYVKHFATLFKFHWILSKSSRLILHWFTINVFMVLCSTLMEHNLTTKCAHKKYTYVFNIEKYTHINSGIYLAIFKFLLPVTTYKYVFKIRFQVYFHVWVWFYVIAGSMIDQILCFKFSIRMFIVQIIIKFIIMNHDS